MGSIVLQSRVEQPDWYGGESGKSRAVCATFPLPEDHDTSKDAWFHDESNAVHGCNGIYSGTVCPKRQECLEVALVNNESHGVWGGFLPEQRKWIRKQRRATQGDRITSVMWTESDLWRHRVPSIEDLEEALSGSSDDEEIY